jgi:hypothetical protein
MVLVGKSVGDHHGQGHGAGNCSEILLSIGFFIFPVLDRSKG